MSKRNGKNEGGVSQGKIIQINEEQIKGVNRPWIDII